MPDYLIIQIRQLRNTYEGPSVLRLLALEVRLGGIVVITTVYRWYGGDRVVVLVTSACTCY